MERCGDGKLRIVLAVLIDETEIGTKIRRIGLSIVALQQHFHLFQNKLQLLIILFYTPQPLSALDTIMFPVLIFSFNGEC